MPALSAAVTRIRTWVTSATTKGTNHYTITATATEGEESQGSSQVNLQQTRVCTESLCPHVKEVSGASPVLSLCFQRLQGCPEQAEAVLHIQATLQPSWSKKESSSSKNKDHFSLPRPNLPSTLASQPLSSRPFGLAGPSLVKQ